VAVTASGFQMSQAGGFTILNIYHYYAFLQIMTNPALSVTLKTSSSVGSQFSGGCFP